VKVFWYPSNDVQRNLLLLDRHFYDILRIHLARKIVPRFFQYLPKCLKTKTLVNMSGIHTSRTAQSCGASCSLIFPFGKPHPDDDFQPLTRIHWSAAVLDRTSSAIQDQGTFSHVSFSMIAPQTGTRVLYCMKVLNACSWS
jgi:hypothetical protein